MTLIVFDFDGTIADSLGVFVQAANRLAAEYGYPQVTEEQIPFYRSLSSREVLQQLTLPKWQLPFFLRRFRRELNARVEDLQPIPGMPTAIQELHQQGYQLGIISSNAQKTVLKFLNTHQLTPYFDWVAAGQLLLGKDRVLRRMIRVQNLNPQQIICVGDETRDIEAAQQVNLKMIAVSWGFNTHTVLARYHPDALIDAPTELVTTIRQLQSGSVLNLTP
jgi:phosphoglycolate phosphatase